MEKKKKKRGGHPSLHLLMKMTITTTTITTIVIILLTSLTTIVTGQSSSSPYLPYLPSSSSQGSVFSYNSGGLITTIQYLKLDQSPFNFYEDVIVTKSGKLVIQEGVILNFAPNKGLYVTGSLVAVGSPSRRITFTSSQSTISKINYNSQLNNNNQNNNVVQSKQVNTWPDVRLVDGDSPNEGRLQIKSNNKWHSVCTNSKNWTLSDIKVVCNQLGFHDGSWYQWYNKFNDSRQLMLEEPGCLGRESRIDFCPNWIKRQVGSGTCDYHADIGIRCTKKLLSRGHNNGKFWSGIVFNDASYHDEYLPQFDGRLKRKISDSILDNVDITFAGESAFGESSSAILVKGIPPVITRTSITLSPGTGINITDSVDGFTIKDTLIAENRGHGLFVNTSWGQVNVNNVRIENNGADGIRYNLQPDLQTGGDFCYFSNLGENQVYPIRITHEQKSSSLNKNPCCQEFRIRNLNNRDAQLTVHFPNMASGIFEGEERDRHRVKDGYIEVLDGYDKKSILKFKISNNSMIPSVTSSESRLYVCYQPAILKRVLFTVIVTTVFGKAYDLNITKSIIKNNNGRGVWVTNQRSGTVLNHTIVSNHTYIAGVHVHGAGDLIVNNSHVTHNYGDGINGSLSYGCRHVDRSEISMNTGRGVALWTNESTSSLPVDDESTNSGSNGSGGQVVVTSITYSEIWGNLDVGVFVSNVCLSDSFINISMNGFKSNRGDAIEVFSCHHQNAKLMSLLINNNKFIDNHRLAIRMSPIFNVKTGIISSNLFKLHSKGVLFINNQDKEDDISNHYEDLRTSLLITDNVFTDNSGLFVVSIGVLQRSSRQEIEFSQNILENNQIQEPYPQLNPRSRVAAVVVVSSSSNTRIIRNNLINPLSKYEIGCHLDVQHSAVINASFNYFGEISRNERTADIYDRIFDRKNRYNLAQVEFLQYRTNPYDFKTNELLSIDRERDKFVPFRRGQVLGGEVRGYQTLETGVYNVIKDIFVREGSRLHINQGTTLIFDQSIGMMVQGKLESVGSHDYPIKFTGSSLITNNQVTAPVINTLINSRRDEVLPPFIDTRPKDVPNPSPPIIKEEINPVVPFIRIHNPRLNESINPDDFAANLRPNNNNISIVPVDAWTRTGWPREARNYNNEPRRREPKWSSGEPLNDWSSGRRRSKRQVTSSNIRLSNGREGRLEVNVNGVWGSVCSYDFDITDAAIACQQMGLVLNSRDWLLEKSQFMSSPLNYNDNSSLINPIVSRLKCTNIDTDILSCPSQTTINGDFFNSCHSIVGIKCYEATWSGIRLGMAAEESVMNNVVIEKAGLLDYSTNLLKPALQVDFHRHRLSQLTIQNNAHIGIGFMWNELFLEPSLISLTNSLIYGNGYHGISTRNQGLNVLKCEIDNNQGSGFNYDAMFTLKEQTDLISWIVDSPFNSINPINQDNYGKLIHWPSLRSKSNNNNQRNGRHSNYKFSNQNYQFINDDNFSDETIKLDPNRGSSWYLQVNQGKEKMTNKVFTIETAVEHSLGIMILNPSYSDGENLTLSNTASDYVFNIKSNLSSFPLLKYSYKLQLNYSSGNHPRGDIILYISVKPLRNYRSAFDLIKTEMDENKIIKSINLLNNNFNGNQRGISLNHYNQDIGPDGEYYHRHRNETILMINNVIRSSKREAILINSPLLNDNNQNNLSNQNSYNNLLTNGPLSEINITLLANNITRNSRGMIQYSRDMRSSNNLFHFVVNNTIMEFNNGPLLVFKLPYVWSYNENFTHSISLFNNSITRNKGAEVLIDGFFAKVNVTNNLFRDNHAKDGLIKISGMEKELLIQDNVIEANFGHFMIEFNLNSHADQFGLVSANLRRNVILRNRDVLDTYNNYNNVNNNYMQSMYHPSSYTIAIRGCQYINMTRNLINNPNLQYELLTGVLTGSLETVINVQENWWGSSNYTYITSRIFDFDDWNSYAIASFSPYLGSEYIESPVIMSDYINMVIDTDIPFGGRVHHNLLLRKRRQPYIITSDLTIMPGAVLTIEAGVTIEFFPSIGILVLGEMTTAGHENDPIVMKPARLREEIKLFRFKRSQQLLNHEDDEDDYSLREDDLRRRKRQTSEKIFLTKDNRPYYHDASDLTDVRLCITESCSEWSKPVTVNSNNGSPNDVTQQQQPSRRRDGYLEVYNQTSLEWISVCDPRFTERNAQVVCSFLGHSIHNVHLRRGRRADMNPTVISRVRYWPEPLECSGKESSLKECDLRLNGVVGNSHSSHACTFDGDNFVYIYCGPEPDDHLTVRKEEARRVYTTNRDKISDSYWGGIRFAQSTFEQTSSYQQSRPNSIVSDTMSPSRLQHLNLIGAGILHGEKNAAIQMVNRDVSLEFVNISNCASHGIEAVAPSGHLRFSNLNINNNLGYGINYILLGTASTSTARVPYKPLITSTIPYNLYGLVNICDPNKSLFVEERILIYYKYDNHAVDCVKIIKSSRQNKQLAFRMLQFNLFNSTNYTSLSDSVEIFDGDIFNSTVKRIGELGVTYFDTINNPENRMYVSTKSSYFDSLSLRLHASGSSSNFGFVAEVVTIPSSYFVPRGFSHNLTHSSLTNNVLGALNYKSAGEVAPSINNNFNRIEFNCDKLLDNFTTCNDDGSLSYELQNTPTFTFTNNLIKGNQGGLSIATTAQTAAGALNAFLINNLFINNVNNEALKVIGPEVGAQQIIEVINNYFTFNHQPYKANIQLKQVVANFTKNIIVNNHGLHQLMVIGIDNSFQTIRNNWFYNNFALKINEKSTIFASNPGQQYVDNYLVNPDNDFELSTKNRSFLFDNIINNQDKERERQRDRRSSIDAKFNWWGFNETTAVLSRILDGRDYEDYVRVDFNPFHQSNRSVLSGICSGGWERIGHTCFLYIGSRMTFTEAKEFCEEQNSTMPVVSTTNQRSLTKFLKSKQDNYDERYFRVWVQSFSFLIEDCTILIDNQVIKSPCYETLPFFCEKDPDIHVLINAEWYKEPLGLAAVTISTITFSLTLCCICCWLFKSREKSKEKLQRRNSIRASIRSNRSFVGSSVHSLNDISYSKRQLEVQKMMMMSRNPNGNGHGQSLNGSTQQLRTTDFMNNQHPASRRPSFDSLNKRTDDTQELDTFRSSQASLGRGMYDGGQYDGHRGHQQYDRNRNVEELEDRFQDAGLENANVSMMVHPTFDLTFENEAFREGTPSDGVQSQPSPSMVVADGQSRRNGNGHVRKAPPPPVAPRFGPSARLMNQQVAPPSPSSIGHFSRRSVSPSIVGGDNRFNTYETFKSIGGQSSIIGGGGNKKQQHSSTFQSTGSIGGQYSDITSASGVRAEALTRQIREELSIRDPMMSSDIEDMDEQRYLETSLDNESFRDNNYDYFDYNSRQQLMMAANVNRPVVTRFSPSVSMTTLDDSSKEQPLETAM